jgi:cytoskeletal protein RodZ
MDEIGQILREARENKGLSLQDVQAKTRISIRYLEALENGQYSVLPTPVHVRGFLRNYARFLGLDPKPLLDRYEASQGAQVPVPPTINREITPDNPLPDRQDQPFFDPVNMEVESRSGWNGGGSGTGMLQVVIIVALLIALGLVANRFIPLLIGDRDSNSAVEEITSAVQDVVNQIEGITPTPEPADTGAAQPTSSGAAFEATPETIVNTSRNDLSPTTPTPTRPPLPATLDEIRLKLDILERTWMEVTIDGEVVYSGIAKANDAFEWTAAEEAKLVTGNAIGVYTTINDVELGRMGDRGERYEEVWRTTQ